MMIITNILHLGFYHETHTIQFLQITDDTAYQYSALQAAKTKCWGEKAAFRDLLALGLPLPDMSERRAATYGNSSCLNECNGLGVCVESKCID